MAQFMHFYPLFNSQRLAKLAQTTVMLILLACISLSFNHAFAVDVKSGQTQLQAQLEAKYLELSEPLKHNQFKRALYINSTEANSHLKGEIYAVVDYPFNTVNLALNNAEHWCDALILHINIKYCRATIDKKQAMLTVYLGKKEEQALKDAHRIDFEYRTIAATPDYFALELHSKNGPIGTSDYRILVEATTIKSANLDSTFLHFSYGYQFGLTGKLGMQGYLSTIGKHKVGFTEIAKDSSGEPIYLQGVRGIVERNTMRYYLAIDSYLSTLLAKGDEGLKQRLQHWYNSNEMYHRQLHEVERSDYMAMKQREYLRQQSEP